jgi:hypothetical protein
MSICNINEKQLRKKLNINKKNFTLSDVVLAFEFGRNKGEWHFGEESYKDPKFREIILEEFLEKMHGEEKKVLK